METYKRVFVIVLDSLGIGAMPDSEKFGDKGVDTFGHILDKMGKLDIPNIQKLGMLNLHKGGNMEEEVEGLMKLFRSYLKKCMKSAEKNHMRVKVIGDPSAFAPDIQEKIRQLEEFSKDYDELYFQIALNYGSRDEIVRGVRKLAQDVADGKLVPDAIDECGSGNYALPVW